MNQRLQRGLQNAELLHYLISNQVEILQIRGSMPFRVELDNIKDIGVPVQSAAVSPVAVD